MIKSKDVLGCFDGLGWTGVFLTTFKVACNYHKHLRSVRGDVLFHGGGDVPLVMGCLWLL